MKQRLLIIIIVLINSTLYSQNLKWEPVSIDVGANINTIHQDSLGRLIVLSESGLYLVKDLKETEKIDEYLPDSIEISCVAVNTKNQIFAGTMEDGVFQYIEDEKKWAYFSTVLDNPFIRNISINSSDSIAVGTADKYVYIYNPLDKSWTWIKTWKDNKLFSTLKYNSNGELYAVWARYLYKLIYDVTFHEYKIDYVNVGENNINSINYYDNECFLSTSSGMIYYTNDSFKSWAILFDGIHDTSSISSVMITNIHELIITTFNDGIYYSNNNGNSFEQNNESLPVLNVRTGLILKDNRVLVSVEGYGLYISEPSQNNPIKPGGWIPKQNYSERRAYEGGIDFIKFSNDGKKIFTVSGTELKIWEAETGYLLKTHSFKNYNKYNIVVSEDDSTVIVSEQIYDHTGPYFSILLTIYNIRNDSVVGRVYSVKDFKNCYSEYKALNIAADYDYKNKELLTSCRFTETCDGSSTIQLCHGNIQKVEFSDSLPIRTAINDLHIENFVSQSTNKIAVLYNSFYSEYDYQANPMTESRQKCALFILDSGLNITDTLSLSEIHNGITQNSPVVSFTISKNGNFLAGITDSSKIILWNLVTKSRIDSVQMPFEPVDYKISKNEKYILTALNTKVLLLSINDLKKIDSVEFNTYDGYNWKIAISPDSRSFAVGSSDGIIRLVKFDEVVSVEESYSFNDNTIKIMPNPVTDKILIRCTDISEIQIQIYTSNGVLVQSVKPSPCIDVGNLAPGLYFLRIGASICSFIKI